MISEVDRTEAAVTHSTDAVVAGAGALDGADEAAASGDAMTSQRVQPTTQAAVRAAEAALTVLPAQIATYRQALTALGAATTPGSAGLAAPALAAVVTAGRVYADAVTHFDDQARTAWPAYAALRAAAATWLVRATAGWFRTPNEAGAAYAVLTTDQRPSVQQARSALAAADQELARAAQHNRVVLAAADRVLR